MKIRQYYANWCQLGWELNIETANAQCGKKVTGRTKIGRCSSVGMEGKRPLGRPRRRWVDNIRMDLQEVGCGYVDWIGLAQDRDRWRTLVSAVMNLRVP